MDPNINNILSPFQSICLSPKSDMEIPEGSLSSSSIPDYKYDVFLSFRGSDTRLNFTAHLHQSLKNANMKTFYDDEEIDTGVPLKQELKNAIKASRASVIVLSENYASSRWCLEELELILHQNRTTHHIVFPIFYHVHPTDVRNQQRSFEDSMGIHIRRMEVETNVDKRNQLAQKIEIWRNALTEVSNLKGADASGRREPEFIEEVIKKIRHQLGVLLNSNPPNIIGMDRHVDFISSWLKDGSSHTADILTVLGMGGIGKTYLAKHIYRLHHLLFDRSSFITDISVKYLEKSDKILELQTQLYSDISKGRSVQVNDVSEYTSLIEKALKDKKVLIVLDDVDSLHQLKALLGDTGFQQGSKIIITTKDASLTKKFELNSSSVQPKHTVRLLEGLEDNSSMKLFRLHAFGSDGHGEGYEQVSKSILNYCQGNPKALEVLGMYLCKRSLAEWEEHIELLDSEMDPRIATVLLRSFKSLFQKDKELFKHIASFFAGRDRDFSEAILNACKVHTLNGIKNLTDRFLLTIGPRNELNMHQLLQHIGRDVVRQESPKKPWKRSLLWCKESFNVMRRKKDKGNLKGIVFDRRMHEKGKLDEAVVLKTEGFSSMYDLMLLHLNDVQLKGSFENFPEKLRWLSMHRFHLDCIPPDLPMENLVVLDMSYSKIKSFDMCYSSTESPGKVTEVGSKDKRLLRSLKILNLSFCYHLQIVTGFSKFPELERLILAGCRRLKRICESIEACEKLLVIDLSYCSMLKRLPQGLIKLKNLQALSLDGCNLDMMYNNLPKVITTIENGINSQAFSSIIVEDLSKVFNSFRMSSPSSLAVFPNLQKQSFPVEFSFLSTAEKTILNGIPTIFLPNCVRSVHVSTIELLEECNMLKIIETPSCTLGKFKFSGRNLLQKIALDIEMSPLDIALSIYSLAHSWIQIEGIVKIQPIAREENIFYGLGWNNLHLIKDKEVESWHDFGRNKKSQVQLIYEFGIFSTFYGGESIPEWINARIPGSKISFEIPTSHNNLRGLNFCYLQSCPNQDVGVNLLTIIVSNITKNHTWIYKHYIHWVKVDEECLIWLSHWMFGKNEMEGGDKVEIFIPEEDMRDDVSIKECGVSFVYDDRNMVDDPFCYYKSWNHIIGGDLSAFCLTTGEYLLDNHRSFWWHIDCPVYRPFIAEGACYQDKGLLYRAFSRKSDIVCCGTQDKTEGSIPTRDMGLVKALCSQIR